MSFTRDNQSDYILLGVVLGFLFAWPLLFTILLIIKWIRVMCEQPEPVPEPEAEPDYNIETGDVPYMNNPSLE